MSKLKYVRITPVHVPSLKGKQLDFNLLKGTNLVIDSHKTQLQPDIIKDVMDFQIFIAL